MTYLLDSVTDGETSPLAAAQYWSQTDTADLRSSVAELSHEYLTLDVIILLTRFGMPVFRHTQEARPAGSFGHRLLVF